MDWSSVGTKAKAASLLTLLSAIAALVGLFPASCSQGGDPSATTSSGGPGGSPNSDICATPNEGCPCGQPGALVDCGRVEARSGDYVSCSMGKRSCEGARWGACLGDQITTKAAGGIHVEGFGASTACTDNPCDPYCNNFIDNIDGGVGADGGFTGDGGLGLISYTGPTSLQTTSNGQSACGPAANLTTPGQACDPATVGSCKQDFRCDTSGGSPVCVWNGGEGYYDKSVSGADLTIGTACDIGFGNIMPVCNRGSATVPADADINVFLVPQSTIPDGCAAAPHPVPDCTMKVPAGGLLAGSCVNLTCDIPGNMNAVVNPGGTGAITEGTGMCANNTAFVNTTDGPPGCATCISCNTYISGTVHDPGLNVGLAGITVFEPYTSPSVITDNVPATGPVCDSCTSLLDPTSFSTGVNTNNDGTFSMSRVTPGPNRWIVAQTGRWRRKLKLDIPACVTTALTDDQIRMPKNRSEGDIPKMALVTGSQEALDCWLTKVGIDANEIWPRGGTAPGDVLPDQARIQVYYGNGLQELSCPLSSKTLGATCGSCNSGLKCNAGANSTCLSCGANGQACCATGSPCATAGSVCDDTNTCTACGANSATCCATGAACSSSGYQCNPASNTCTPCGTNGKAACPDGTCAAGTVLNSATKQCVTCGGAGQMACAGGTCSGTAVNEPSSNTCQTCGTAAGRPCCAGNTCSGSGLTCSAKGVCLKTSGSNKTTPIPCGGVGDVCCTNNPTGCMSGLTCSSGTCTAPCGGQGQACCASGAACTSTLSCTAGKCGSCGGVGEACCAGNTCTATGATCGGGGTVGICGSCGDVGEACCNGTTCSAGLTCGGGGAGRCGRCGGHGEACCPTGAACTTAGDSCNSGVCDQLCGGNGQAACAGNTCAAPTLRAIAGTCQCDSTRPAAPLSPVLWDPDPVSGISPINEYSAVILPCTGIDDTKQLSLVQPASGSASSTDFRAITAAEDATMLAYTNSGGRVFMDHLPGSAGWLHRSGSVSAWNGATVSTWTGSSSSPSDTPAEGFILNTAGPQATMNGWLSYWAPYTPGPGAGWLKVGTPRKDSINPGTATTEWIRGKNDNNWGASPPAGGDYDLSFSFETPIGATATCGRVIYNDMHVAPSRSSNNQGQFPRDCSNASLTDEELALEYQFFQLTACALGGSPPPPPPPPPPAAPALVASTFTRDYQAICPAGSKVVWQFFSWQALVPTGTNIVFTAQTAPDQPSLTAAPSVGAGTASVTTTPAGTWFHDTNTVEWHLNNDIAGNKLISQAWLRISMLFNPSGSIGPILDNWRQVYDCIPDE